MKRPFKIRKKRSQILLSWLLLPLFKAHWEKDPPSSYRIFFKICCLCGCTICPLLEFRSGASPLCPSSSFHLLFRAPKMGTYSLNCRAREAPFPVRDSKKLSRAIGTDCCSLTVTAVYLKTQSSYAHTVCTTFSSCISSLLQICQCTYL